MVGVDYDINKFVKKKSQSEMDCCLLYRGQPG